MSARNLLVLRAFVEQLLNTADPAAFARIIADEFVNRTPLPGMGSDGAALLHGVQELHVACPGVHFAVRDVLTDGDRAVVRWEAHGTCAITGVALTDTGVTIARIGGDGTITEIWSSRDPLGLLQKRRRLAAASEHR